MIEGATFSMEESERILQIYLKNYDIEKVYKQFKRRDKRHLRQHLKRIIRQTIVSVQANMFTAKKIKSLTLYDYQSNQMFQAFMNLQQILPETQKQNFLWNFRKIKQEGCRMFRKGRTEFYVEMSTDQRQRIYSAFIKYCEDNDLYKYSITTNQVTTNQTPPYSEAGKVYPQRDLQLIYKAYKQAKGNQKDMQIYFIGKKIDDSKYFGKELEDNLYNIKLIGNFIIYKTAARAGNQEGIKWEQFRDRYPINQDWDHKIQLILLRVGIRQDPSKLQIKQITRLQSRKYIQRNAAPNAFNQQDYWKMYFDDAISKIKGQMKKVMVVQKKSDNNEKPPLFQRKQSLCYHASAADYSQMLKPLQNKVKKQSGNGQDIDYTSMFDLWRQQRAMDRFTMQKKLFQIAEKNINRARYAQKREE